LSFAPSREQTAWRAGDLAESRGMVEVAMRPRFSPCSLAILIAATAAMSSALPASGQSLAAGNAVASVASNIPATWSTDPSCSAQSLRLTFGGNALAIERNGRVIFRGPARLAVSDDEIAVRLGADQGRGDPERNIIRFSRAAGALRLASVALPGAGAHVPRVPPLYPCRPPGVEANGAAMLPASATLSAPAR